MSRMERWKRAEAMDMDPPVEVYDLSYLDSVRGDLFADIGYSRLQIKEILLTQQGLDDARYRENVLHTFAL